MTPPVTRSHTRNLPSGFQSPSDQRPDFRLSDCTSTLDEIKTMLNAVEAASAYENSVKPIVNLFIGQMKGWRLDQIKKGHEDLYRHQQMTKTTT